MLEVGHEVAGLLAPVMARWRRYPGWSLRRAPVLIASLRLELDLVGFERFLVIEIVGTMTSSIGIVCMKMSCSTAHHRHAL